MPRDLTITVRFRWWVKPFMRSAAYLGWLVYPVYLVSPAASARCLDWLADVLVRGIVRCGTRIDHTVSA